MAGANPLASPSLRRSLGPLGIGVSAMEEPTYTSRPGIVDAAIVPHAPQFLTLPATEDHEQVARVNAAMRAIGEQFRALDPDLLIVIATAHSDEFGTPCVRAFAVPCGTKATG